MTSVYFYYVKLFILRDWLTTFRDTKVSKIKKKPTKTRIGIQRFYTQNQISTFPGKHGTQKV